MSKYFQRSIFGVSVILLLVTVWGSLRAGSVRADQKEGAYPEMEVYSEVLNKIQNDYVVDPNMNNVISDSDSRSRLCNIITVCDINSSNRR